MTTKKTAAVIPLFEHYPLLREKLPHVSLGEFPTPVEKLRRLGGELGIQQLYVKRDDLSGSLYGGNKPRKLEFILGDVLQSGAREVMTFGGVGSNHALATAIYARYVGVKSISMLIPQPNARYVRDNLLMGHCCGAELHACGAESESVMNKPLVYLATIYHLMRRRLKTGRFPYLVPPGGSSLLGVTGYVNAAFELRQLIASGEIPEPQYIYVACGTMGTAAGLHLGLRAAKVGSHVVSVRVTSNRFVNRQAMVTLAGKANAFIHSLDPSFPVFGFSPDDLDIRNGYFGKQYALFTEEAMHAACLMRDREGIELDGTYTGKTMAALIDDARNRSLRGKSVLFWNTLNSRSLYESISNIDYRELPRCFHRYFEDDVQPLDRRVYTSQLPA